MNDKSHANLDKKFMQLIPPSGKFSIMISREMICYFYVLKIKLFHIIHLQFYPPRNYFRINEHGRYSRSKFPISIKIRLTDYVTRHYCRYYIEMNE